MAFKNVLTFSRSNPSSPLSRLREKPIHFNKIVDKILRFLSTDMFMIRPKAFFLSSVRNSSHVPRDGISSPLNASFPVLSSICVSKYAPGDLTIWETMTRSAPLMMKVPVGVIIGKSPKKTSSFLVMTSPVSSSMISNSMLAFNGAR